LITPELRKCLAGTAKGASAEDDDEEEMDME